MSIYYILIIIINIIIIFLFKLELKIKFLQQSTFEMHLVSLDYVC